MDMDGITYRNVYFLRPDHEKNMTLHLKKSSSRGAIEASWRDQFYRPKSI